MVLGELDIHMQKNVNWTVLYHSQILSQNKELNVRLEMIKILKETYFFFIYFY